MALTSRRLVYIITGQDHLTPVLKKIAGESTSTLSKIARVGAAVSKALVGASIVAGIASVKLASDFQTAMAKIRGLVGVSQKQINTWSRQILQLGSVLPQTAKELADALYFISSAGFRGSEAMNILVISGKAAAAGLGTVHEVADAVTSAMNAYRDSNMTAAKASDILVAAVREGKMPVTDLAKAVGTVLPVSAAVGVEFSEVAAMAALVSRQGGNVSRTMTGIRYLLTQLIRPSGAVIDIWKRLGWSADDIRRSIRDRGLIKTLLMLKKAMPIDEFLKTVGGARGVAVALAAVRDSGSTARDIFNKVTHAAGSTQRAFEAVRKTAQFQLRRALTNIENVGIRIGAAVLPALADFAGWISDTLIPILGRVGGYFKSLIPIDAIKRNLATAEKNIGDFFNALFPKKPKVVPVHYKFLPGKQALSGPFGPAGKLPTMRQTVAIGRTEIFGGPGGMPAVKQSDATKLGIKLRNIITGGIKSAFKGPDFGKSLGTVLGNALNSLAKNAGQLANKLINAMSGLDWVEIGKKVGGNALGFAIGFISSLGNDLFSASFWKKHWWDVIVAVLSIFGIGKFGNAIAKIISKIPIIKHFAPLFRGLQKIADPFWKAVAKIFGSFGKGFLIGFGKVFPRLGGILLDFFTGKLPNIIDKAMPFLRTKGLSLLKGLGSGILKGVSFIGSLLGRVVGWIIKPFASAGKWLLKQGRDLIGGLWNGIKAMWKPVGGWLNDVKNKAFSAIGNVARTLWNKGLDFFKGLWGGLKTEWNIAAGWVKGTGGRVLSAVGNVTRTLWNKGVDIVRGFLGGIKSFMAGISSWIKGNIVDPVVNAVKHWFGISSPSTIMFGIGKNITLGLIKGIAAHNPISIAKKVFGTLPQALAHLVTKGLVSVANLPAKALNALMGAGGAVWKFISGLFGGGGGGGGNVTKWLTTALKLTGMPLSWLRGLQVLVSKESGGNPRAVNPIGVGGEHATGLFQTLPSTFYAYRLFGSILDPVANAVAGIRYIRSRYGSVYNIPNLFGGPYVGYGKGGIIREPVFGFGLSGRRYMFGEHGKPETVIPGVPEAVTAGGGLVINGDINITPKMLVSNRASLARELVDVLQEFADKGGRLPEKRR